MIKGFGLGEAFRGAMSVVLGNISDGGNAPLPARVWFLNADTTPQPNTIYIVTANDTIVAGNIIKA